MSINRVILIGTLGQDPKIGQTQNGKDYANFSLATSKKWKDQSGEKKEDTSWHNISCFGPLVKVLAYVEKGSRIYLEGEIKYEKYTDKNGEERIATKIIASAIDIIKGKDRDNYQAPKKTAEIDVEESQDDEFPF